MSCHRPRARGSGLCQVKLALMHEILGRCGPAPNIFGNQAPDSGNSELIAIGATPDQREKWLEPLLRGELTSSFSMTEPHYSGSDPTMIKTFAVRDGDEYVINGHKWFARTPRCDLILICVTPEARRTRRIDDLIPEAHRANIARNVYKCTTISGHFALEDRRNLPRELPRAGRESHRWRG